MPRKLQQDYLELVDVFPLPYLPDTDKVCAYFRRGGEGSDSTRELLELFKAFFADYERKWTDTNG
jgi:DNA-binding transcriptional LysR family regulator